MKEQSLSRSEICAAPLRPAEPIPAEQLFASQDKVRISFKGQVYTLSLTRNDKLILTK